MGSAGTDARLPLFEYTDFHQTNSHLYIFGYTAVGERGKLLRVSRTSVTSLDVECDERDHTVESYEKELRNIQEANHSNGGLQPVCKVRARNVRDQSPCAQCTFALINIFEEMRLVPFKHGAHPVGDHLPRLRSAAAKSGIRASHVERKAAPVSAPLFDCEHTAVQIDSLSAVIA
jgi:hypothetical protein